VDQARYIFGVMTVTFLPPGVVWWFIVHPFIEFWRRVGARGTIGGLTVFSLAGAAGLWTVRDTLLMRDFGTHAPLVAIAAGLATVSVTIALQRRKQLTVWIMAGVPELEEGGKGGVLLTEGIYSRIRHPRYVEIIFGTLAYGVFSNYLGAYLLTFAIIPVIHLLVLLEERELRQRFGSEYERYEQEVPRYFPRLKRGPTRMADTL
jgi:protein-S-isoprenylcysteine O-methyltransferase Ste14